MVKLMPHQVAGTEFLVDHPKALLADGMRCGKSIQTIAACDVLSDNGCLRILVICPASLREQWRRQFREFSAAGLMPVVLSYEEATRDADKLAWVAWEVVAIDEAHYLKNRKSKRTNAVLTKVIKLAQRVWCLTGTPSPNNAAELWPMLHSLFPETIAREDGKPMNYWQFTKRFCIVRTTPFGEKIEGNRNTEELRRRMEPIMLRRPSSILGNVILPPETLYLDVAKPELARLEKQLREELGDQFGRDPEAMTDKVKARIGRLTGLAKVPALAALLADEFEGGLDKVVLFCWHRDVAEHLYQALRVYLPVIATGSHTEAERVAAVKQFQSNPACRVIIGNIKAIGVGQDLTAACELVFAETSWVPGDNDQAAMRITGVNQKRAARVRYAVLPGSVDERLTEVNRRKSEDIQALFGT